MTLNVNMDCGDFDFDEDVADDDILGAFATPNRIMDNVSQHALDGPSQHQAQQLSNGITENGHSTNSSVYRSGLNRTGSGVLKQTTLFGGTISNKPSSESQPNTSRVYRADLNEVPSHHSIDLEAMETWIYPTNLGAIRDYQFSIVKNSLFNNTLVALPTGLGKTFIAATVMLNFYRWTKNSKIIFVAPTKPLVSQQVEACYNIAGIPRSETTLLTGDIAPALRVDEWSNRRVFFMTPQTLLNDLSHGYADPKSICLLVIDEAHRAVGEYAYAKVTKLIRRFSNSFRVLALTATPGSKIETVQEVIDNLGISHCEIRTEDSIDIRQYVHDRSIETMVLDPSDEMNLISELFSEALKPLLDKLSAQNIWYGRSPMAITAFGLLQSQKDWFATRGKHVNQGIQFMMRAIFVVLTSLAHSIKLLNYHGIKPFYDNMVDFRNEIEDKGAKGSKYKRQLIEHPSFQDMMNKISFWVRQTSFVSHPKLTALTETVLNHFMDRGEASGTRVIVFSEYRDSAEDIVRQLNLHRPLMKASIFVGQADGKRGEGMKQAQQIQTIEKFRKGDFNVLVATSIGEEGLDIGQVDLIVCYDASASPIRMLQRMGRTGRKRAGNIVLLLMRGKEEDQFAKSKDNYEKMQSLICEGSRFNFRFDLSTRIVPRGIRPEVDKRHIDIPVENEKDQSLPVPKTRRALAGKKMPKKKFHMPDGVETGFQNVMDLMVAAREAAMPRRNPELDNLEPCPSLDCVILDEDEAKDLERSYRDLPYTSSAIEETAMPSMTAHPEFQRTLTPTVHVRHGLRTKRCVTLLRSIGTDSESLVRDCRDCDTSNYLEIFAKPFVPSDDESEAGEKMDRQASTDTFGGPLKRRLSEHFTELDDDDLEDHDYEQAPKGPQSGEISMIKHGKAKAAKAVKAPKVVKKSKEIRYHDADLQEGEEIGLTRRIKRSKKGKKRDKATNVGHPLKLDEIGDDCDRDSDELDSDGSDFGSDLLGFIVSDNKTASSLQGSPAPSPSSTNDQTPNTRKEKPFFVPTIFSATQESDDMPDVDTLVVRKGSSTSTRPTKKPPAKRAKKPFMDDYDDSCDDDEFDKWLNL